MTVHIDVIATEELGDRSYVVHDGQVAPVVETHIHNDYVTGGFHLATAHECRYVVCRPANAEVTADGAVILDVRRDDERAVGAIPRSAHIPMHSLLQHMDDLPQGQLWVHSAVRFCASIAVSLLDRAGRDVVLIDDDYGTVKAGLATS